MSVTLVVGPVGCGKTSSLPLLGGVPVQSDGYQCRDKNFKIQRDIQYHLKRDYNSVVENGGHLFLSTINSLPFLNGMTVESVVAPKELVEFVAKFPRPATKYSYLLDRFGKESFLQRCWGQCNNSEIACGKAWRELTDSFVQRTLQVCQYRIDQGIYQLNYDGVVQKFCHFKDIETMNTTMTGVTRHNLEAQFQIVLWALVSKRQIKMICYEPETHQVRLELFE